MEFFHEISHKGDELCVCFDFLNECSTEYIYNNRVRGKKVYCGNGMAYYPFSEAKCNAQRYIPIGDSPELTIIDPRGVYRLVSNRTYGKDSVIYFDKGLSPLHHAYSHKQPFKPDPKKEREICVTFPHPSKRLKNEYMIWDFTR